MKRSSLTKSVRPGDIVYALGRGKARHVCFVEQVTARTIRARVVTTQRSILFDKLGVSIDPPCRITSAEPPPYSFRVALLELDRKTRLGTDPALSKEEIWALVRIDDFFSSFPLAD
jgi:hypothetical protein